MARFEGKKAQLLRASGETTVRARQLRLDMTMPERVLWSMLRRCQIAGLRFRRQHPLGPYIADFYCHEAALIVEVDSRYHEGEAKMNDLARDEFLSNHGIQTLRITAGETRKNPDAVRQQIHAIAARRYAEIQTRTRQHGEHPPSPACGGGGPA